jgi:hypothetical protein
MTAEADSIDDLDFIDIDAVRPEWAAGVVLGTTRSRRR